ncbi:hypothetical protein PMIN01_05251 [Paraphaeosphaeria minitans]|uniref:Uncharacterized protein n=1 Tax=Paraphaeosphaeria minitans TaxID=565426 RepID=A0A9P6GKT6_9PLEO|nr:hypothetical protein PMIN01_05251 [Paraphaeosphaeria minitans]
MQISVGISPLSRNDTLHSTLSQPSPYSPTGSPPPPPSTPWHGISSSYYRDTYSPSPSYVHHGGYGTPQPYYPSPPNRAQSFKEWASMPHLQSYQMRRPQGMQSYLVCPTQ